MAKGLSPMMAQYFDIKSQYPGMLLFFRLGDFYEMFFDDAKTAAEELDLVLTGKDCGMGERAPMCGVPFHSAENYIAKLVSRLLSASRWRILSLQRASLKEML